MQRSATVPGRLVQQSFLDMNILVWYTNNKFENKPGSTRRSYYCHCCPSLKMNKVIILKWPKLSEIFFLLHHIESQNYWKEMTDTLSTSCVKHSGVKGDGELRISHVFQMCSLKLLSKTEFENYSYNGIPLVYWNESLLHWYLLYSYLQIECISILRNVDHARAEVMSRSALNW